MSSQVEVLGPVIQGSCLRGGGAGARPVSSEAGIEGKCRTHLCVKKSKSLVRRCPPACLCSPLLGRGREETRCRDAPGWLVTGLGQYLLSGLSALVCYGSMYVVQHLWCGKDMTFNVITPGSLLESRTSGSALTEES